MSHEDLIATSPYFYGALFGVALVAFAVLLRIRKQIRKSNRAAPGLIETVSPLLILATTGAGFLLSDWRHAAIGFVAGVAVCLLFLARKKTA